VSILFHPPPLLHRLVPFPGDHKERVSLYLQDLSRREVVKWHTDSDQSSLKLNSNSLFILDPSRRSSSSLCSTTPQHTRDLIS
jgi:hypothetical protein